VTLVLGIETSCDETAASVVEDGRLVRSNVVASQHDLHRKYHGVVPEIASRSHLERIWPVLAEATDTAGVTIAQVDALAVGNRPGLIGSLLVGVSAAQALAWSTTKPLIGIDHVQAHLYAASLLDQPNEAIIRYPAIGLVVSGGHTSLYTVTGPTTMQRLGKTIDDAVGEAYDKAAVILDAGYPGGPRLDKLAQRGTASVKLPRSLLGNDNLDFSFSGLKTALLYAVRGHPVRRGGQVTYPRSADELTDTQRADLAASFQIAAVDALILKLERVIKQQITSADPPQGLIIGGGVCANSLLRRRAVELGRAHELVVHLPPLPYCLDNAAMIAGLAHHFFQHNRFDDLHLPAIATGTQPATSNLN